MNVLQKNIFFFKFDQYRNKARLSLLRWQNGKFTETLVVVVEFTKAFTQLEQRIVPCKRK